MSSTALPKVEAHTDDTLTQLHYMFGGLENTKFAEGRIEVGSTAGECRFFKLSQFNKIASYVEQRTRAGEKTYIHAGLIKPDGEKVLRAAQGLSGSHSKSSDVLCWPCLWGEADHKDLEYDRDLKGKDRNLARLAAFRKTAAWGLLYATGSVPTLRMQGLLRLERPAAPDDPQFWQVLKSITHNGKLDAGANNSSQLIRLAGSVSFAGSEQKAVEVGEPQRIDEAVRVLHSDQKRMVSLPTLHANLALDGKLIDVAAKGALSSAKGLEDLKSKVKYPKDAKPLDKVAVLDYVAKQVAKACEVESGGDTNRRSAVLATAKAIGGLLWTGHVDAEDFISDDDDGVSLVEAYHANGGAADNGENNIAAGILDAMATGAASPLLSVGGVATDGTAFGVVDEDDDMNDALMPKAVRELHVEKSAIKARAMDAELGLISDDEKDIEAKVEAVMRRFNKPGRKLGHYQAIADAAGTADAFSLARMFNKKEYVVQKILPDKAVTLIYGNSNVGKTFYCTEAMDCVQRGRKFGDFETVSGGAMLFLSEGQSQFSARLAALYSHRPVSEGDTAFGINPNVPEVDAAKPDKALRMFVEAIITREVMSRQKMRLVAIDNLSSMLSGAADENGVADMKIILRMLSFLANALSLAVIVIHHENSAGGMRGSTAIRAAADNSLQIKELEGGFAVYSNKARDDEKSGTKPLMAGKLVSVTIGVDNFGHDATSAVVEFNTAAQLANIGAGLLADDEPDDGKTQAQRESDAEAMLQLSLKHESLPDFLADYLNREAAWCDKREDYSVQSNVLRARLGFTLDHYAERPKLAENRSREAFAKREKSRRSQLDVALKTLRDKRTAIRLTGEGGKATTISLV